MHALFQGCVHKRGEESVEVLGVEVLELARQEVSRGPISDVVQQGQGCRQSLLEPLLA